MLTKASLIIYIYMYISSVCFILQCPLQMYMTDIYIYIYVFTLYACAQPLSRNMYVGQRVGAPSSRLWPKCLRANLTTAIVPATGSKRDINMCRYICISDVSCIFIACLLLLYGFGKLGLIRLECNMCTVQRRLPATSMQAGFFSRLHHVLLRMSGLQNLRPEKQEPALIYIKDLGYSFRALCLSCPAGGQVAGPS